MPLASQIVPLSAPLQDCTLVNWPTQPPSPISRLSEDTLTEIFVELNTPQQGDKPHPVSRAHPLFVASHACHNWRHILLSSPLLWTSTCIVAPETSSFLESDEEDHRLDWIRRTKALPKLTRIWISRSQNLPLSLTLSVHGSFSPDGATGSIRVAASQCYTSIFNQICNVAGRWRDIDISVILEGSTLPEGLTRIRALRSNDVPLLRDVHAFDLRDEYTADPSRNPTIANGPQMGGAVRLLCLLQAECRWQDIHANWSTLTDLRCKGFHWLGEDGVKRRFGPFEALSLLKKCPNLIECSLQIEYQLSDAFDNIQHGAPSSAAMAVRMRHLKTLVLESEVSPPGSAMAGCLILPSLCDLRFAGFDRRIRILKHWMNRFGKQLTTGGFGLPATLSSFDALELLGTIPNVKRLILVASHRDYHGHREDTPVHAGDTVLRALTNRFTAEVLCPRLRIIELCYRKEFFDYDIMDFIESRRNGSAPGADVARIEVVRCWSVGPAPKCGIWDRLCKEGVDMMGLDIKATYSSYVPRESMANYFPPFFYW